MAEIPPVESCSKDGSIWVQNVCHRLGITWTGDMLAASKVRKRNSLHVTVHLLHLQMPAMVEVQGAAQQEKYAGHACVACSVQDDFRKSGQLHEECPHARSWEHCNVCCATAAGVVPHYKVTLLPCEKVLWDPTGVVGAHKGLIQVQDHLRCVL